MFFFINSRYQHTLHILFLSTCMWIKYLTPVMQVKGLWFLIPQETVIIIDKGFCTPKDVFMDSKEGMGEYPLTQIPHLAICISLK